MKTKLKVICLLIAVMMMSTAISAIAALEVAVDNDFIAAVLDEAIANLEDGMEGSFELFSERLKSIQRIKEHLIEKIANGYTTHYCQGTKFGIIVHYENCNCMVTAIVFPPHEGIVSRPIMQSNIAVGYK